MSDGNAQRRKNAAQQQSKQNEGRLDAYRVHILILLRSNNTHLFTAMKKYGDSFPFLSSRPVVLAVG